MQDNVTLRDDLYEIVLRLKGPWAAVQLTGASVLLLALVGLIAVWRRPK